MSDAIVDPEGDAGIFVPPPPLSLQFRHRTTGGPGSPGGNSEFHWTRLDHPALDDRPQAILTVTPVGRLQPGQPPEFARPVPNGHPVGVLFRNPDSPAAGSDTGQGRWYIYNLGLEPMEPDLDFHVAVHEARRPE